MDTKKLIICRGIQGSGKSTWAKQWCHEDPEHRIRVNRDDVRNMLGDYWVPNREKLVSAICDTTLAYSMEKGYNIVVDNMNLNPKTCAELEKMVKDFNENYTYDWKYEIEYRDFFIPVEECILRDSMRPNPIGEKVIRETWRRYRDIIIHEDIMKAVNSLGSQISSYSDEKEDAIIVDMDATLCYNTSKRPFWGEGAAKGMLTDIENIPVADLVRLMHSQGCKVLIVTGREGAPDIMEATKTWLKDHNIPYDDIFFRPYKDYGKGAPTKQKIFEENISPKYNVRFVLDDNYKCVKMYRDLGLTVLQPNEGKF